MSGGQVLEADGPQVCLNLSPPGPHHYREEALTALVLQKD